MVFTRLERFLEKQLSFQLLSGAATGAFSVAFIKKHWDTLRQFFDKLNPRNYGTTTVSILRHFNWEATEETRSYLRQFTAPARKFCANCLLANKQLSEEFLEEYVVYTDDLADIDRDFSTEFLQRHIDRYQFSISCISVVNSDFLEQHFGRVHWNANVANPGLTEELLERHFNELNLDYLSQIPWLSQQFVEKHLSQLNIKKLSGNHNLSQEFWEQRLDQVDFHELTHNPNISEAFWKQHLDRLDQDGIEELCAYGNISPELILKWSQIPWDILSHDENLPEDFIEKHADKLDWNHISRNRVVSKEFWLRHLDKLFWYYLVKNLNVDVDILQLKIDSTADPENYYWDPFEPHPAIYYREQYGTSRALLQSHFDFHNIGTVMALIK